MISFIVPAYNEEAWLGRCLFAIESAAREAGQEHEVIVVDDASTDGTSSVARACGGRVLGVEHRQISAARNSGAREAKGDILFFVDADTVVTGAVVGAALRAVAGGAAGGGCVPKFDAPLPWWFKLMYPAMVFVMRHLMHQTGGACLFCTRKMFGLTGGFSEAHFAAEEDVWVKSLKRLGRFVILDDPVVTSGRSLRTQSFRSIARVFIRLALRGPDGFRGRDGLDIWYQPNRVEGEKSR